MKIGRLARWYRWIEYTAFGRALERSRFALLPRLAFTRRILIPGEGDGRTLRQILAAAPRAHIDVVEISPEMIALAQAGVRGQAADYGRITFQCQDARTVNWPNAQYDAIVTNFFIDCFSEADARDLIGKLANALKPNGIWLVAEFATPASGWRRLHGQVWIRTMYRFFGFTTGLRATKLPPIDALLREAGMLCVEKEEQRAGLMVSERWTKSPAAGARRTSPGTSAP